MKTVVITGATQGMGLALARTYLERGDRVGLVGRTAPAGIGGRAHLIQADLSVVAENQRVIEEINATFPAVDALVFCARHFNSHRAESRDGFEHTFALFYLSRFLLGEGLLAALERADEPIIMGLAGPGEPGARIDWDDLEVRRDYDGLAALGQAGRLTDLLGVSFVDRHPDARTRYVLFHPGVVSTSFSGSYDETMAAQIAVLQRTGKPIADAIAPILAVLDAPPAAPLSAFVEGAPLAIDGEAFDPGDARRLDQLTRDLLSATRR